MSDKIIADVVECDSMPELARAFDVRSVPKLVVGEGIELLGSQTESDLVAAIRKGRTL